jgi:chromosome segregation ATPase
MSLTVKVFLFFQVMDLGANGLSQADNERLLNVFSAFGDGINNMFRIQAEGYQGKLEEATKLLEQCQVEREAARQAAQQAAGDYERECKEARDSLAPLQTELLRTQLIVTDQNNQLTNLCAQLATEKERHELDVNNMGSHLSQLQNDKERDQKVIADLHAEVLQLKIELQAQIAGAVESNTELSRRLDDCAKREEELLLRIAQDEAVQSGQLSQIAQIAEIAEREASCAARCDQLVQQLAGSAQLEADLQAQCEHFSQQLAHSSQRQAELQDQCGQLSQQLSDLQVERSQQAELLAIKTEIETQLQAQLVNIRTQVQDCVTFYSSLDAQNQAQQQRIAQLEATVTELEQEKKTLVAESEAKIEEQSTRVKSLLDDILKKFSQDCGPQAKRPRSE